ncbi:MAG: hypothetical protein PHH16_00830 [Candidatus Gracilibacteria bacterium]|nr:hypothetical protein [Candidatus Gracilibacteria bacterium]
MNDKLRDPIGQQETITMTHGEAILFSRIKNLRFSFDESMLKKLARFKVPTGRRAFETRYLDPDDAEDYRFLVFLNQSEFQDISIAYHLFIEYVEKNHETFSPDGKVSCLDAELADIDIMYKLYFAGTIKDMIDILDHSDLEAVLGEAKNFTSDDLIMRLWQYNERYEEIEAMDQEGYRKKSAFPAIGRVISEILSHMTQSYDDPDIKRQQKQALLNIHVFGGFPGGERSLTRALGIRWHVQRIFSKFDQEENEQWHQGWKKELGIR